MGGLGGAAAWHRLMSHLRGGSRFRLGSDAGRLQPVLARDSYPVWDASRHPLATALTAGLWCLIDSRGCELGVIAALHRSEAFWLNKRGCVERAVDSAVDQSPLLGLLISHQTNTEGKVLILFSVLHISLNFFARVASLPDMLRVFDAVGIWAVRVFLCFDMEIQIMCGLKLHKLVWDVKMMADGKWNSKKVISQTEPTLFFLKLVIRINVHTGWCN